MRVGIGDGENDGDEVGLGTAVGNGVKTGKRACDGDGAAEPVMDADGCARTTGVSPIAATTHSSVEEKPGIALTQIPIGNCVLRFYCREQWTPRNAFPCPHMHYFTTIYTGSGQLKRRQWPLRREAVDRKLLRVVASEQHASADDGVHDAYHEHQGTQDEADDPDDAHDRVAAHDAVLELLCGRVAYDCRATTTQQQQQQQQQHTGTRSVHP